MPFCHLTLKGLKPKDSAYPETLRTLGDRVRAKRLDLGLRQKDIAEIMGVSVDTICYWEGNRVNPARRLLPKIGDFFGSNVEKNLMGSNGKNKRGTDPP